MNTKIIEKDKKDLEYIKKIICKVRSMYQYNAEYKEILSQHPSVELIEKEKDDIELSNIIFSWYDSIRIYKTKIVYYPEYGHFKVLCEYKNFDELLNM